MSNVNLSDREERALRAYTDVLAIEWDDETGMARVVTLSDCYRAIPAEGLHLCPDREYNIGGGSQCKHTFAVDITRNRIDAPVGWLVTDNLDYRSTPTSPPPATGTVRTDGGNKGKWIVEEKSGDREWAFDTRTEAEERVNHAEELGLDVELYQRGKTSPTEEPTDETTTESAEQSQNDVTVVGTTDVEPGPKSESITDEVAERAEAIINQLDHEDMKRLVWDPDMTPDAVPYDPQTLPYNRPEPSAEAYDLFAHILEQSLGVSYSVDDVEWHKNDESVGCTVIMTRTSEHGEKRLIGVKTRAKENSPIDHRRERLYSKARRNCLKTDVPPTFVLSLLKRYKGIR